MCVLCLEIVVEWFSFTHCKVCFNNKVSCTLHCFLCIMIIARLCVVFRMAVFEVRGRAVTMTVCLYVQDGSVRGAGPGGDDVCVFVCSGCQCSRCGAGR